MFPLIYYRFILQGGFFMKFVKVGATKTNFKITVDTKTVVTDYVKVLEYSTNIVN